MRIPTKVPNTSGAGVSRKSYMAGYHKSANAKVDSILGKRKLSTPAVKPLKRQAPVSGGSADAGPPSYTQPQPMRVSYGDTGEPADDQYDV